MYEGAVYCPKCGARRARAARTDQHAPCPACRATMHDVQVGDTAMLECTRCRAVWIDAATFEHVCATSEAQAAVLHHWPAPGNPNMGSEVRYRKCVACGTMMNRLNFGKISGTIVDVCKGHGTLLDAGELHRIVSFVRGGGLERTRQRQIDELKDEEQRLRTANASRPSERGGNVAWEGAWSGADLLSLLAELKD
jgi:Zn-finger nucleic acid-binding protein